MNPRLSIERTNGTFLRVANDACCILWRCPCCDAEFACHDHTMATEVCGFECTDCNGVRLVMGGVFVRPNSWLTPDEATAADAVVEEVRRIDRSLIGE